MTLTGAAVLPALSDAPLHVAVTVPTVLPLPPLTLSVAFAATPERLSLVVQPATGTDPTV